MAIDATLLEVDNQIYEVGKRIKVLSALSWPARMQAQFLSAWHEGNVVLPEVDYPKPSHLEESLVELTKAYNMVKHADEPVAKYLRETAQSYIWLCELLNHAGSHEILTFSRKLYGEPGDAYSDSKINNLDAANHFLNASSAYNQVAHLHDADYRLSADEVSAELTRRLDEVFPDELIKVVVDPELVSKAAASATRIRLRDATRFSEYDVEQLLQHEAFVHSLTALNGREQPLKCLSLGAPRTTEPQEGLATFSEVISGAVDINRMRRIALRVVAIDQAIDGADFIEVFRFFIESGQTEAESYSSTMRVFRGAPTSGGAAFTKDVVYLHGLMEVNAFFQWSLQHNRLDLCRNFFAGRMTISDAILLDPLFADATLKQPKFLPTWMTKNNGLTGYLAFSVFTSHMSIDALGEHYTFELVR